MSHYVLGSVSTIQYSSSKLTKLTRSNLVLCFDCLSLLVLSTIRMCSDFGRISAQGKQDFMQDEMDIEEFVQWLSMAVTRLRSLKLDLPI
ncbi:hypothetical protein Y032_0030g2177 [Ancylostoma ceylanicum]|nr:hypothetical protein Y032_0030g2177 [Ancylostoma ceylanicum]